MPKDQVQPSKVENISSFENWQNFKSYEFEWHCPSLQ
jgi:hypothetical protein